MGEGVNGRLKYRHMPAVRIPGWIAEAVFLVATVDIFPKAAGNAPHTGKLCFAGFILSHKHTDRLAMIPRLIEQPFPETPADHIRTDTQGRENAFFSGSLCTRPAAAVLR